MKNKLRFLIVGMLFLFAQNISAQEKKVTGTVTDAKTGMPLVGVAVIEKGTENGTITDFDGNYSIEVPSNATLEFSMLGYSSESHLVSASSSIDVALSKNVQALDQVVVTSLGITREKKSLGYAVTELESGEINSVKDHNVANSLIGKVAGVAINPGGGIGAGSRIIIRGNNTLTGGNQPLVVVDGVPIDASGNESGGDMYNSTITGGGIADINTADIKTLTVLKGPNAAALYGSRAANGVILITTKTGKRGTGLGISINSNITFKEALFLPDYQNQYGQGANGAPYPDLGAFSGASWGSKLDGSDQLYYTGQIKPYVAQPDNVSNFFETGLQSINSLALTQGGEEYSVRFSYTNNSTTSIIPNSTMQSHNFNLRAQADLSDKLSIDAKATYFTQELENRLNIGSEGILAYVYMMPRNVRIEDLRKYKPSMFNDPSMFANPYNVVSYSGQNKSLGNPYWMLNQDVNDQRKDRFFGFAKVNYAFTDWLSAFVRIGADVTNAHSSVVNAYGHHFFPAGQLTFANNKFTELNTDFLITANRDITEKLNVSLNVGGNLSKRSFEGMSVTGKEFKIPGKVFLNNTAVQSSTRTPLGVKKVNSLYGLLSLAYDDFMFLDLTARNDWSSTLSKGNRSYLYPSASFAILIDHFIDPDHDVFNMLKLRASYAEVGNDTDIYNLYQTYSVAQQGYLGLTVLSPPDIKYNPDLKPESVNSTEFGLNAILFDNRLYADFSVYSTSTTDMIYQVPVPAATGFNFFLENVGKVENKGFELVLGGIPVQTQNFRWDVSVNYSQNDNTLVSLIEGLDFVQLNETNSGNVSIGATVGGSIGDIYGTVWATNEEGQHLVTVDGIPVSSAGTELLGNVQPDWIGGLSNTFQYKNFSLRALIDARVGGKIFSATSEALDIAGVSQRSLQYRGEGVVLDAVNQATGQPNTERITAQEYWGSLPAENYIYDQTNVRLREVSLSYSFSNTVMDNLGLSSASIGLIARNLLFIYKDAPDIDPNSILGTGLSGQGISYFTLPTVRSLGVNVNIKF